MPSPPSSRDLQTIPQATWQCPPFASFCPLQRNPRRILSLALSVQVGRSTTIARYMTIPHKGFMDKAYPYMQMMWHLSGVIIMGTQITPLIHAQEVSLSRRVSREQEIRYPPRSRSTSGPSKYSTHSGSIPKRPYARADLHLAQASITSGPPSPPRSRLPRPRATKSASPDPVSGDEDKARPRTNGGHPHSMRTPTLHSATGIQLQQDRSLVQANSMVTRTLPAIP
jgi:hypothetical protein